MNPLANLSFRKEKKPEPDAAAPKLGVMNTLLGDLQSKKSATAASTSSDSDLVVVSAGNSSSSVFAGGLKKKGGGSKKSVRWAPDEELVKVREIENRYTLLAEASRQGEPGPDGVDADTVLDVAVAIEDEDPEMRKAMNQQEGMTLTMHLERDMEEEIDWYEPIGELSFRIGFIRFSPANLVRCLQS